MAKTGSVSNHIAYNATLVSRGRLLLYTEGEEAQGRIFFTKGISGALKAFKEAQTSGDTKTIIQAEQVFLREELLYAGKNSKLLLGSLNNAISSFSDALDALDVVENQKAYQYVNKVFQNSGKDRVKGLPNDAFHKACSSHITRIANILKTPGLSNIERELLEQRSTNIATAKNQYIEKQKSALGLT